MSRHEDWRAENARIDAEEAAAIRRQAEREAYWERVERAAVALLAAEQGRAGQLCYADVEACVEGACKLVGEIDRRREGEE